MDDIRQRGFCFDTHPKPNRRTRLFKMQSRMDANRPLHQEFRPTKRRRGDDNPPSSSATRATQAQLAAGCGNCRHNFGIIDKSHITRKCHRIGDDGKIGACPICDQDHPIENCSIYLQTPEDKQGLLLRRFCAISRIDAPSMRSSYFWERDQEFDRTNGQPLTGAEALLRKEEFDNFDYASYLNMGKEAAAASAPAPLNPENARRKQSYAPPRLAFPRDILEIQHPNAYYHGADIDSWIATAYQLGKSDNIAETMAKTVASLEKRNEDAAVQRGTMSANFNHASQGNYQSPAMPGQLQYSWEGMNKEVLPEEMEEIERGRGGGDGRGQ